MALPRLSKFSFAAGVLATIGVLLPPLWFVERRLGLAHIRNDLTPLGLRPFDSLPAGLQAELSAIGAVPDNMPFVPDGRDHRTFLVRPDHELEYVLKPNVRGSAHILRSKTDLNLVPPVVYVPSGAVLSTDLTAYLARETRVQYSFSTTAEAFRTTLPVVASERRVLLVGDSVGFGLGVDDAVTMASQLQARVGDGLQVVNAAVAGYDADQIYLTATKHTAARSFEALIYVACVNDFEANSEQEALTLAADMFKRLATLKSRVGNRVVVLLSGYLEYAVRDLVDARLHGWSRPLLDHIDVLRDRLPALAGELGFQFVDMHRLIEETVQVQGTIFSPFALFVDHVHYSSQGHRIAAAAVRTALEELGLLQ
jgi:lysophospholipase L1-like esterase